MVWASREYHGTRTTEVTRRTHLAALVRALELVATRADSGCDPEPFCANPRYGQCGGQDPSGKPYTPACCPPGFHCESKSQYYSQCVPDDPPFVTA